MDRDCAMDRNCAMERIEAFGREFEYDVSYIRSIYDVSEAAFDAFAAAQGMSATREVLPADAHAVACVATMLEADCGPCTELNLRIAASTGRRSEGRSKIRRRSPKRSRTCTRTPAR